jgi:hypothetical protein
MTWPQETRSIILGRQTYTGEFQEPFQARDGHWEEEEALRSLSRKWNLNGMKCELSACFGIASGNKYWRHLRRSTSLSSQTKNRNRLEISDITADAEIFKLIDGQ